MLLTTSLHNEEILFFINILFISCLYICLINFQEVKVTVVTYSAQFVNAMQAPLLWTPAVNTTWIMGGNHYIDGTLISVPAAAVVAVWDKINDQYMGCETVVFSSMGDTIVLCRTLYLELLNLYMLNCFKHYERFVEILNHILDLVWTKWMKLNLEQ